MQRIIAIIASLTLVGLVIPPATAEPVRAVAPLLGDVVRSFDPPDQPWLSGHRGVDIEGQSGAVIVAAMDGVVRFAGLVVDRPVISLSHGDLVTTYEPVQALVSVGDWVTAGQPIGYLITGHSCPSETCLHWGLRRSEDYLDPLSLLGSGRIRLITADDMDEVKARAARLTYGMGGISAAGLISPVAGVITDAYGMRLHPIENVWRFHDGLDIGAGCGTPIRAVANGTVTESYYHASYGYRLVIKHGVINGHQLTTGYNHAQGYTAQVGDQVSQGQVIGSVGTTGSSTGCHIHFQTWVDGQLADPQTLLP